MQEISKKVRSLEQLEAEIKTHSQYLTASIVTIGQALIEAKAQLDHGRWGEWLKNRVQFSQSTANNFMRVAREVSIQSPLLSLPYTKVLALLDVPAEEREQFAEEHSEQSTAALRKVIKARDDAISAQQQSAKNIVSLEESLQAMQKELEMEKSRGVRSEGVIEKYAEAVADLQTQLKAAQEKADKLPEPEIVEVAPDDYNDLKAEIKSMRQRVEAAEEYAAEAETALHAAQQDAHRARMAQIDADAAVSDDPLSLDAFGSACKALLSTLCAAPHMGAYFQSKNRAELASYTALAQSVKQWAEDALQAIQNGSLNGCIVIEGEATIYDGK